jgi:LacI family transcriptional regulator
MAATYKDIQRLTGLSLSTISKYFNGGHVMEANRAAIDRAAEKLDFRINDYARGLKSKRSKTIGVLIPELNSTFHTSIISDVEDILRTRGYGTIVCDSRLDKRIEVDSLNFLLGKMVDGIITIPFDKSGEHLRSTDERGVPVVLIDRLETDYKADAVIVDNALAAEMAAKEFISNGHRRIAILSGPNGIFTMKSRMEGFLRTLAKNGIPSDPAYISIQDITIAGGYEGAKRLLGLSQPPTALFCTNYELTIGAILAVNEAHVAVPNALSMIGFDDLTLSQVVTPRLTIIAQPMREIAETAAKLMLDRLGPKHIPGVRIAELTPKMIRGGSVKRILP